MNWVWMDDGQVKSTLENSQRDFNGRGKNTFKNSIIYKFASLCNGPQLIEEPITGLEGAVLNFILQDII